MTKKLRNTLVVVAATLLALMFGCAVLQDAVTPCEIGQEAGDYTGQSLKKYMPYTTVLDAERIDAWMDYTYEQKQAMLRRAMEDDDAWYAFLIGRSTVHRQGALQFQHTMFSPEGAVGLLFPAIFGTTLGALLIPKPVIKKKEQA